MSGLRMLIAALVIAGKAQEESGQSAKEVEVVQNKIIKIINSPIFGGVSMEGNAYGMDESFNYGSRK